MIINLSRSSQPKELPKDIPDFSKMEFRFMSLPEFQITLLSIDIFGKDHVWEYFNSQNHYGVAHIWKGSVRGVVCVFDFSEVKSSNARPFVDYVGDRKWYNETCQKIASYIDSCIKLNNARQKVHM